MILIISKQYYPKTPSSLNTYRTYSLENLYDVGKNKAKIKQESNTQIINIKDAQIRNICTL